MAKCGVELVSTARDKLAIQLWKKHGTAILAEFHKTLDSRPLTLVRCALLARARAARALLPQRPLSSPWRRACGVWPSQPTCTTAPAV